MMGKTGLLDKNLQLGFIRKVYGILATQLIATALMVGAFTIFRSKIHEHFFVVYPIYIICLVVYIVSLITLACCRGVARTVPTNYIILAMLTLSMGFMVYVVLLII